MVSRQGAPTASFVLVPSGPVPPLRAKPKPTSNKKPAVATSATQSEPALRDKNAGPSKKAVSSKSQTATTAKGNAKSSLHRAFSIPGAKRPKAKSRSRGSDRKESDARHTAAQKAQSAQSGPAVPLGTSGKAKTQQLGTSGDTGNMARATTSVAEQLRKISAKVEAAKLAAALKAAATNDASSKISDLISRNPVRRFDDCHGVAVANPVPTNTLYDTCLNSKSLSAFCVGKSSSRLIS